MVLSTSFKNRMGFVTLGLTNNFAYVVMLAAAYDLLEQSSNKDHSHGNINPHANSTDNNAQTGYCLQHSTSTILLADTLPSLTTKILYPILLVGVSISRKVVVTAALAAASFIITGVSYNQVLIFTGVICASLSSGLGEATFLSNTPMYGDSSLSGWSMGTGAAGLVGSIAYASMREILTIQAIMTIMLVVPIAMIGAYFMVVSRVPIDSSIRNSNENEPVADITSIPSQPIDEGLHLMRSNQNTYGINPIPASGAEEIIEANSLRQKLRQLPPLAKYFVPLFLVYFAEYFINQGLFEIIYYPEVTALDHAAQYRWFQVTYQVGVMISRSSLDLFKLNNIWAMSLLQCLNAAIFLAHAAKIIYIPGFPIVIALIVYEGLLGGFTYVNAFYRIKKETEIDKQEFNISAVTMADSLGIVTAGLVALPVHEALCKLYN